MPPAKHRLLLCSTSLYPEMCLSANRYTHHGLPFVLFCVPVLLADNVKCQFVMIVQCSFPVAVSISSSWSSRITRIFHGDCIDMQRRFSYCSSFVMLYNGLNISSGFHVCLKCCSFYIHANCHMQYAIFKRT